MATKSLSGEVEELDKEQVKWRLTKLKEILEVTKSGPFIYTAKRKLRESLVCYSNMAESLLKLTKGPIYVHYYKGGITKVSLSVFTQFWGKGQFYCTIFDESFSWFIFTDDNSEDTDSAVLVQKN
ncbi:hypothetical protein [Celerinatantimonas sp. MCCC 1A17872]|uniref:hypothetical protein n=1 Tax=Celerinatantimonas sp. MCCC 1A17872 TaxID=3177514 RepID=UPI0038C5564D